MTALHAFRGVLTSVQVVVAMSGGVDSSVTAKLLADDVSVSSHTALLFNDVVQGYDLSAVFMRNWDTRDESGSDEGCEWKKDWQDVQRVCRMLDIPVQMVRCSSLYRSNVSLERRLISAGNTGSECLSHPSETGLQDCHRIPTFGATSKDGLSRVPCPSDSRREVKFGALLGSLSRGHAWLATGTCPLRVLLPLLSVTDRTLCSKDLEYTL